MADEENEQSPFSRPSFIVAAVVVAAVVVAGVVVGINIATRDNGGDAEPAPSTTASAAPSAEPTADAGGASVCGLGGEELSGTVATTPQAEWEYEGTTAYPTSSAYGPGKTDPAGFRYCFEHSPTGALFMASNAIIQGSGASRASWVQYVVADGPYRDSLVSQISTGSSEGTRITITGFRILAYDGKTARIDLAATGSTQGQNVVLSGVYELVWQDGDWKISSDTSTPVDLASIPNTAGYNAWGE